MNDELRKLGLNKYESLAYETLLRKGMQSGFSLSENSGVPFGRIYDSLKVLSLLGFIETVPGKPKKFKAVNPEIAISNLVRERETELEKVKNDLVNESKKMLVVEEKEESVTVTKGKTAFARKLAEQLSTAKKELIATAENYKLRDYYPSIKRLIENGIKQVVIGPFKGHEEQVSTLKKEGVKVIDYLLPGVRFLITDRELVTISIQDQEHEVINISLKNKALGEAIAKLMMK